MVIDADYRGEVKVCLYNDSDCNQIIGRGERIGQLIIQPYSNVSCVETEKLSDTVRGTGGFGSTGK